MLAERLERTMVDELARLTGNRPMQSMPLRHIAKALGMKKNAAAAMAEHAEQRGWLKFWGGHSVYLTDAGRQIAQSRHKRTNSRLLARASSGPVATG